MDHSIGKMFLTLLYITLTFYRAENVIHNLKPDVSSLFTQTYLNKLILSSKINHTDILIINSNFQFTVPSMYFNSNQNLPNLGSLYLSKRLCVFLDATGELFIANSLTKFAEYVGLLEKSYILVLLSKEPDRTVLSFLIQNKIFNVVFVKLPDMEFVYIEDQNYFERSKQFRWPGIPRSLTVCYVDVVPYTSLGSNEKGFILLLLLLGFISVFSGLELLIVNEAARSVKLPVTFTRLTRSKITETYLGVFEQIRNRNCDVMQGEVPPVSVIPLSQSSTYFLTDATVLVTPTFRCARHVGLVMLTSKLLIIFLLILIGVCAFGISQSKLTWKLLIHTLKNSYRVVVESDNIKVQLFVATPVLLVSVVVLGGIQAQLYDTLVRDQQVCEVKNLKDIVKRKLVTTVQRGVLENLMEISLPNVDSEALRPFLIPENNLTNMNSEQCHILREVMFKYLVPRYYLMDNGQSRFKEAQIINRGVYMLLLRRSYPFIKDINVGLLRVQQSGINVFLEERVCGRIHLKDIAKYSMLLSYYTPVQLEEIAWLIWLVFGLWMISLLVFILEIITSKW